MELSKIEPVKVDPESTNYLLLQVSDGTNKKMFLRAANTDEHRDILLTAMAEVGELTLKDLGGGKIYFDQESKTIFVGGMSGTYGRAKHEDAQQLLQIAFPDFDILINPIMR